MANVVKNRDELILAAAMELAAEDSYQWITREQVAALAGVASGTINSAFGTMVELKRAVIRRAIQTENLKIVAEALGAAHPIALAECPPDLRARALAHILQN